MFSLWTILISLDWLNSKWSTRNDTVICSYRILRSRDISIIEFPFWNDLTFYTINIESVNSERNSARSSRDLTVWLASISTVSSMAKPKYSNHFEVILLARRSTLYMLIVLNDAIGTYHNAYAINVAKFNTFCLRMKAKMYIFA